MSNQLLMRRRISLSTKTAKYLKFTALEDNSSVGWRYMSMYYDDKTIDLGKQLDYSIDKGNTWQPYHIGTNIGEVVKIQLDRGQSVCFRGINDSFCVFDEDDFDFLHTRCVIEGRITAYGDITSLINGEGGDVALANDYTFCAMFYNCESLVTAPAFPSTVLSESCYSSMFYGCTALTTAPELPATTLASSCYHSMFYGCTSLTTAPELPATTLASACYHSMFYGCTALTTAPELPATTLASSCYSSMFSMCTSLTTAPELPATTLASSCYNSMFNSCIKIAFYHVATLNGSYQMFSSNHGATHFIIDAIAPPQIASNTIFGLNPACVIYVPAGSENAYKAAQYWNARAAYIQAIPE